MSIPRLGSTWLVTVVMLGGGLGFVAAPTFAAGPPEAPVTELATGVTATTATLNGELNPTTTATVGWHFAYSTEASCTGLFATAGEPEAEVHALKVSTEVTGLEPNKTYTFCLVATNATEGSTVGGPLSFTTTAPPVLTVGEALSITRTTATLPGTVDPAGLETFYYYQYGTTTSYGGNAPSIQGVNAGSGFGAVAASIGVGGLVPATTYHYRLVATNADGTTYSPDKAFTTAPATPPTVSTGGASNVTLTTATVEGMIDPEGLETSYELDLGVDTTYGTSVYGEAGSADALTEVTVGLQNLAPGSTYHYRLVAINSDGRTYGADRVFTTPAYDKPIVQPPGLPLLAIPAIAFPTETTNTAKPKVKKHTKSKHKKGKHKKPKHKKPGHRGKRRKK